MRLYLLILVLLAGLSLYGQDTASATIFLVRHAEKSETGNQDDPGLSQEGTARAERLANHLRDAGITAIYITNTERSAATAAPLAKSNNISPKKYDHDLLAASKQFVAGSQGGRVLVVAHSNTMPAILNIYAGKTLFDDNEDYDRLYVLKMSRGKLADILLLRY